MARTVISHTFYKYQKTEQINMIRFSKNMLEFNMCKAYNKGTKVTSEHLLRDYSNEELTTLSLRTKVRVKMTRFNCVWDAKKRLMRKGRLANRSERDVNAMLVKETKKDDYKPEEIAEFNHLVSCERKRWNNVLLDRWKRDRWMWFESTESESESSPSRIEPEYVNEHGNV